MTAPCETSGAAPARCSGPSPARTQEQHLAALERERAHPDIPERVAELLPPVTREQAAHNWDVLGAVVREVDIRWSGRPDPSPTQRTPHQSTRAVSPGLTGTI